MWRRAVCSASAALVAGDSSFSVLRGAAPLDGVPLIALLHAQRAALSLLLLHSVLEASLTRLPVRLKDEWTCGALFFCETGFASVATSVESPSSEGERDDWAPALARGLVAVARGGALFVTSLVPRAPSRARRRDP